MQNPTWMGLSAWALTALRIVAALLFWQHGAQKLFGMFEGEAASFGDLRWFAGVLEFAGPLFLAPGLFTRPVAFLLSGEMAVAYFMAHASRGFWPIENRGELAVLYCFLFLLISLAGPGRLAIDHIIGSRRQAGSSTREL